MKPQEIKSKAGTPQTGDQASKVHPRHRYQKVYDGRKQPIRGLWTRSGYYIARLKLPMLDKDKPHAKWVTLADEKGDRITTLAEAKAALARLQTQRRDDDLPITGRVPTLADYIPTFLDDRKAATGEEAVRPSTIRKDKTLLAKWAKEFGHLRLTQFRPAHILRFRTLLSKDGYSARTRNLAVIALRCLLKHALLAGHVRSLPMQGIKKEREREVTRARTTLAEISKIADAAFLPRYHRSRLAAEGEQGVPLKNARQFADYLLFLAYTGARCTEALHVRWADVDFDGSQVTIGADGLAKNHKSRTVDFNAKLEVQIREMHSRRAPDSQWLFPSPQRGERDDHAQTLRESLKLARQAAGLPKFGFHDCRHFFISYCVMSGIDYMTIAQWVGHQDGGVLIGKVYGHIADEHRKRQAGRVNFEPVALPDAATA